MVDVAQYTNEVKRDSEHLVVIQKVKVRRHYTIMRCTVQHIPFLSIHFQDSIMDLNLPNGHDLRQYGRLLLDGDLNIKAHEDQKTKHRYAFIFEKLMILVKPSNTKVSFQFFLFVAFVYSSFTIIDCVFAIFFFLHRMANMSSETLTI